MNSPSVQAQLSSQSEVVLTSAKRSLVVTRRDPRLEVWLFIGNEVIASTRGDLTDCCIFNVASIYSLWVSLTSFQISKSEADQLQAALSIRVLQ